MKAIVVHAHGGPEVLGIVEKPTPEPGIGEVLIDVAAAGVNYIDVYHRSGLYPVETPFTPGLEGAGTVAAVGDEVTEFAVGDAVAWSQVPGSYASQLVAPASSLVRVPDDVPPTTAAASLLQGLTALILSSQTYEISGGDVVVVHAGAGGVGMLLIQLAKLRGARVITTVSTEAKAELARQVGADEVIGYDGFADQVAKLTDGDKAHVVYDGVGAATFDGSLRSLRPRGLLVLFGQASGPVPPMDPQVLAQHGSLYLTRPTAGHYLATPERMRHMAQELFGIVTSSSLSIRVGGEYELEHATVAHKDLQARRTTGKLLLMP